MNKYKQVIINLAILTFLLSSGATAAYAVPDEYNYNGDIDSSEGSRVLETFEDGDYSAWREITGHQGVFTDYIDKDKFNKFIKARKLARGGKYSEALILIKELENEITQIEKTVIAEKNDARVSRKITSLNKRTEYLKKKLESLV